MDKNLLPYTLCILTMTSACIESNPVYLGESRDRAAPSAELEDQRTTRPPQDQQTVGDRTQREDVDQRRSRDAQLDPTLDQMSGDDAFDFARDEGSEIAEDEGVDAAPEMMIFFDLRPQDQRPIQERGVMIDQAPDPDTDLGAQDEEPPVDQRVIADLASADLAPDEDADPADDRALPPVDRDGDGQPAGVDCDDEDPRRAPGLAELCDEIDNDCDLSIDEGLLNACGACGPLPEERCDSLDNDCDGLTDERLLNACGACGPLPEERCDSLDNDCDGEVDEDTLNACGNCGPLPEERCDSIDNDCDGLTDERLLNACGNCGPLPEERCDSIDNDCDGLTDERLLNACGACGPLPEERCDSLDNDCDGEIDEDLVLNACGTCGQTPEERCDALDNDCDGEVDEDTLNACGDCGPLPEERCDSLDNDCDGEIDEGLGELCACLPSPELCNHLDDDCDGQVDESLAAPCISLISTLDGPMELDRFGRMLHSAGDLNGDGFPELYVSARRGNAGVVSLYDGQLFDQIQSWSGSAEFGVSLTSGDYDLDGTRELAVGAPDVSEVRVLRSTGPLLRRLQGDANFGRGAALETGLVAGREALVFSDPERACADGQARCGAIIQLTLNQNGRDELRRVIFGRPQERLGERIYPLPDINDDQWGELIATSWRVEGGVDRRGTELFLGEGGNRLGRLSPPLGAEGSFADAVAYGRFGANPISFAFSAPLIDYGQQTDVGAVYFYGLDGQSYANGTTNTQDEGFGAQLVTLPRPISGSDTLLVGNLSGGRVYIWDRVVNLFESLNPGGESFGRVIAISRLPTADGSYRLWISEADANRVWVYSAR
ncbi:MAG: MopE-related protein [Myxococcota bacterium]|nr:MopE-related protein [Myxococcota bacterium]